MVLTDRVDGTDIRLWYARLAVEHGWSRNVLQHHIASQLHTRKNASPTPADIRVAAGDSDLVRNLVKDPYRLDFLELDADHSERQLENAMSHRMTSLLEELGPGFAFVGRQAPLRVGDNDFHLDLLFYHWKLRRFVVIELKTGKPTPAAIGQLGFYLKVVDDQYRQVEHGDGPTIGILLTGERDDVVVEYALGATPGPMAAVTYQSLPDGLREQLPSPATLTNAIGNT
jgi:predicted nuclease of restriction endonuclease-like (RecB) superfamily